MGFFSAVKKFFGHKPQAEPSADVAPQNTSLNAADTATPEPAASTPEPQPQANGAPFASGPGTNRAEGLEEPAAGLTGAPEESPEKSQEKPPEESQPVSNAPTLESPLETQSNQELLTALRAAPPRLSAWLEVVLADQDEVGPEFWRRLTLFLEALEAPRAEIDAFLSGFRSWLEAMEYTHVEDFRSELQYRLALALDLEDEEDERNRLMLKLSEGLQATREQLGRRLDALFASHGELTPEFWEDLEEMFIMADMGYNASLEIVERLKQAAARQNKTEAADVRELLIAEIDEIFKQPARIKATPRPEVILMMGVNGAGKTTTIAKLAHRERMAGKKVLIAAADTFRAAAIEQLDVWAKRAGADFYAKPAGSDPAAVAWEAMDYAAGHDIDTIFVDTAGRLQTRVNLMEELGKIRQVLNKKMPGAPHRNILVLDATTGQNALSQAKLFKEAAGADEIALTKLDGTAKGGVAIAVAMQEKLPITYVGLGEKMEDLRPFNGHDFARALLMREE